jgi:exopolyphosphatase/guanosine-5'-triphosphate,3'-diphosphate pyrophosphatase
LLVAEVTGREVRPLLEKDKQTRLGQGFYSSHLLQPGPISQTAEAVARFVAEAREQAAAIRVIATSAVRDATNASELTTAVERACGIKIEVISGDQEAELVFRGVITDPQLRRELLLILEVGGGSSEVILGHGEQMDFCHSFPLGTVRLLSQVSPSDPPKPQELADCRQRVIDILKEEVEEDLTLAMNREANFQSRLAGMCPVGTGGTASILGCMEAELGTFDRERLESSRLTKERLTWHVERLWGLPLTRRREVIGLPPNRADVILMGAVIYESVLRHFDFTELRISTRGLRFGTVLE